MKVTTQALIPHVKCDVHNIYYNFKYLNYHDFHNK
jgi:hypothetical protein